MCVALDSLHFGYSSKQASCFRFTRHYALCESTTSLKTQGAKFQAK